MSASPQLSPHSSPSPDENQENINPNALQYIAEPVTADSEVEEPAVELLEDEEEDEGEESDVYDFSDEVLHHKFL